MMDHRYSKIISDHYVFIKRFSNEGFIILLLYVDDMLIINHDAKKIKSLKKKLSKSVFIKTQSWLNKSLPYSRLHSQAAICPLFSLNSAIAFAPSFLWIIAIINLNTFFWSLRSFFIWYLRVGHSFALHWHITPSFSFCLYLIFFVYYVLSLANISSSFLFLVFAHVFLTTCSGSSQLAKQFFETCLSSKLGSQLLFFFVFFKVFLILGFLFCLIGVLSL